MVQMLSCRNTQTIFLSSSFLLSYVVDSADVRLYFYSSKFHFLKHDSQQDKFNTARFELHQLLSQPTLTRVPLLVVREQCSL
jgi:hypothetical protein